ncbi:hypothetical protein KQI88_01690 [Alkaliphilus sp. MSJ-5]|uniref:SprT-like domain-containing protein n=1 Tax=Alkaliphilus flagellatus TaxID=2841507 RepID=A0ABS6FY19_9FIRM|nr:SprT-like domain-containing protein [Alkaliphilus flagellatus]MBU5675128.1 hypothetical protein [Alkaliphilus flagellatus]
MKIIIGYKYDKETIEKKRAYIFNELIKASVNIKTGIIKDISISDLKILFELYDSIFLSNWFKDTFKGSFKFSLSKRMTKSAGLTLCPKNINVLNPENIVIEFRIGVNFFFQYDLIDRTKIVCGIETNNGLEALQLVLEHEICHAIEYLYFYKSSCRGDRFKTIANNLFGHTNSYHQLPTNKELAMKKFDLSIGDKISFIFKGKKLKGIIYRINKRATIMVQDKNGQYVDKQGDRYVKYYVDLNRIVK